MKNITKDKGDLGLTLVIADLTKKGYYICLPVSEHLPFDLVAVREDGKLARIQVKYRTAKNGIVEVPFRSVYSNGQGARAVLNDFTKFDGYAVYCPDVDKVFYYPNNAVGDKKSVATLRLEKAKIRDPRIKYATEFESVEKIFGSVA